MKYKISNIKYEILLGFLIFNFLFLIFADANAAELYFSSSADNYNVGDIFKTDVKLNTEGEPVNTAQVEINFDALKLDVVEISTGASVLALWPSSPSFSNQNGTLSFIGGLPNGFNGNDKLVSIFFKAKQGGSAKISFSGNSSILLNDGRGTKAALTYLSLELAVSPASTIAKNELNSELIADNLPPEPFEIKMSRDPLIFDGKYFIVFSATDFQSGISNYEIKEGNSAWRTGTSPYLLERQDLKGKILVKAIDRAGNEKIEELQPKKPFPYWIISIAIVGIILFLIKSIWRTKLSLVQDNEKN